MMAPAAKTFSAKSETADSPVSAHAPVPTKRSGKLLVIILLVTVLILIIVVVALIFFAVVKKKNPGKETAAPPPQVVSAQMLPGSVIDLNKPPVFVQLEPFTVNLRTGEGEDSHYLQTNIALRTIDQKTADALKGWTPEIRNRINLILTSKSILDVQNDMSHEKIQSEILRGLNAMFGVSPPPPEVPQAQAPLGPIQGVLFISFIVQ